jgi:hypothetical protein
VTDAAHSPEEILAELLADEIRTHGSVRPPWVAFPGVHPFHIAWRMGAGETHVMLWRMWAEGRPASELTAVIARPGPVPADWSWWVADALDYVVDAADIYDEAFENVRAKLADAGIAVDGVPSES